MVAVADVDALGVESVDRSHDPGSRAAGATTVLRAHGVLSGILGRRGESQTAGRRIPAKGMENLPRKTAKSPRVPDPPTMWHRLADESGQHRALVLTLAYCGLRWGEADRTAGAAMSSSCGGGCRCTRTPYSSV